MSDWPEPLPPILPPPLPVGWTWLERGRVLMVTQTITGLKFRGKFLGVEPGTTTVYADRATAGDWERVILTKHEDGRFDVVFSAAKQVLSVTEDGDFECRQAVGPWEIARGGQMPPDWPQKLVYDNGLALDVVA